MKINVLENYFSSMFLFKNIKTNKLNFDKQNAYISIQQFNFTMTDIYLWLIISSLRARLETHKSFLVLMAKISKILPSIDITGFTGYISIEFIFKPY